MNAGPTFPYNPLDPAQAEDLYSVYARARAEAPVFFAPTLGIWVVTRHDDVVAVLEDPVRFSSANFFRMRADTYPPEVQTVLAHAVEMSTLDSDPPVHTRYRAFARQPFSSHRVQSLRPRLARSLAEHLDTLAGQGRMELMSELAHPWSAVAIAEILGIPHRDIHEVLRWNKERTMLETDPSLPLDTMLAYAHSTVAYCQYIQELVTMRRRQPGDDVLSDLLAARAGDGSALNDEEAAGVFSHLFAAGYITTVDLIGNATVFVVRRPELARALSQEPMRIPGTIDEILRLEAPVQGLFRTATQDVELGGATIPRGAHVQVLFASANRDSARFANPDELDVNRSEPHLSFGHGIHRCVGSALARLQGQLALEALLSRLPGLRLAPDAPPVRAPNLLLRGYRAVHLVWDVPAA